MQPELVRDRIPHCQQLVMKGAMHHVKRYFLRSLDRSFNMLNMIAQIVITDHNDRAGKPLVDDTCHSKGAGLAQIHQFCEILQRAFDFGWIEMLSPLPFHGQLHRVCGCSVCGTICASSHWEIPVRTEVKHL